LSKITNTTPGDYPGPLVPGSSAVFSLKNDAGGFVDFNTLNVRYGQTGIVHSPGVLPEDNYALPATIAIAAPERVTPVDYVPFRSINNSDIRIAGGANSGVVAGVYEVSAPIYEPSAVLGVVSFKYDSTWSTGSRYWTDISDSLGLYFGLEYGPSDTGVFVSMSQGNIIAGGPLSGFSQARPGQIVSSLIDWRILASGDLITLYFIVDELADTASVLYQDLNNPIPVLVCSFSSLQNVGNFPLPNTGYPQSRGAISNTAILYFGHGGGLTDVLDIVDFQLYTFAPLGVRGNNTTPHHAIQYAPDLPIIYKTSDSVLPTHQSICRWNKYGMSDGDIGLYYLPGKALVPIYTNIGKNAGTDFVGIGRIEPKLHDSILPTSFMVEARVSGSSVVSNGVETGMGIAVELSDIGFFLTLLEVGAVKTVGLRVGGNVNRATQAAYIIPGLYPDLGEGPQSIIPVDWTTPRVLRLTFGNDNLELYVDNLETPILRVGLTEGPDFPSSGVLNRFSVGHFGGVATAGILHIDYITYLNNYTYWGPNSGYIGVPTTIGEPPPPLLSESTAPDTGIDSGAGYLASTSESGTPEDSAAMAQMFGDTYSEAGLPDVDLTTSYPIPGESLSEFVTPDSETALNLGPPIVDGIYTRIIVSNTYDSGTGYMTSSGTFQNTPDTGEVFLVDVDDVRHEGTFISTSQINFPTGLNAGDATATLEYLLYAETPTPIEGHFKVTKADVGVSKAFYILGSSLGSQWDATVTFRDEFDNNTTGSVSGLYENDKLRVSFSQGAFVGWGDRIYVRIDRVDHASYDSQTGSGLYINLM
jgi:hypothetical protein